MSSPEDHKALIASLPAGVRSDLCAQTDGPALRHIAIQIGLIFILGSWIALEWASWQLLILPQGILLVFLFTALHETIHRTAFRTDWLNDWTARICGALVLLSPSQFRYFHMAHHRYTHQPDYDPELAQAKPGSLGSYLVYLSGLPELWSRVTTLIRHAVLGTKDSFVPARGRGKVRRESVIILGIYAGSLMLFPEALLFAWFIPRLIGEPFLRAYLLAEHARCPHVSNMLSNTRTTYTNSVVRWLAWNMPYHAEHHAYPAVPFHKLPAFNRLTREALKVTAPGYASFNRDYGEAAAKGRLLDTKGRG